MTFAFWRAALGHVAVTVFALGAAWLLSDTFASATALAAPDEVGHLFC